MSGNIANPVIIEYYVRLSGMIENYIDLNQQDSELIMSLFKYKHIAKNTTLIAQGAMADSAFFILSGYLKYFKTVDSGEELICHLFAPNSFATSLNGFLRGTKSEEELQTITDCELFSITKSDLEKLYATDCKWQVFGRKLMEGFLIEKEQRIIDLLSLTAHDKYSKLIKYQPDIIQNVPVKYIASFIGVQPESLSRIRKIK